MCRLGFRPTDRLIPIGTWCTSSSHLLWRTWHRMLATKTVDTTRIQKTDHGFHYFSDHNEHAIPLFVDAHILLLKFFYYESIANFMFDTQIRTAPSNIQDLFQHNLMFILTHSSASDNFYTKPSTLSIQANSSTWIGKKMHVGTIDFSTLSEDSLVILLFYCSEWTFWAYF